MNAHEAWIYQLGYLGRQVDIVDDVPGRYCRSWDARMRPVPEHARLIDLETALGSHEPYDCILAHNVSDLLAIKDLAGPRILVIHGTLEGRARNEGLDTVPAGFAAAARTYLDAIGGHAIAVSAFKAKSWGGFADDIIPFGVDVDAYPEHNGRVPAGLRVSNLILARPEILLWDLHRAAFHDVPVRIVGHNPDMPGVAPSGTFDELKTLLAEHRFFVHTAHPDLEDGYNMAVVDAMACGLAVLGNPHHSSPIVHGQNGFLSNDPAELNAFAHRLIEDPELSASLGRAARKTARERFGIARFVERMERAFERARHKHERWKKERSGPRVRAHP